METMPIMGHTLPRLGFITGAPPVSDRLPMISPDFEENYRRPTGLQNGPIFCSKSRMGISQI